MTYSSADALHDAAQQAFVLHLPEALDAYPSAIPSHICIRAATNNDYNLLTLLGAGLGDLHEQSHGGRALAWVRLHTPLTAHNAELNWLEITAPKDGDNHPTGPQMLVLQLAVPQPVKLISPSVPTFMLRFQAQHAEQLARL